MMKKRGKKAQITIFVIIALIIAAVIFLFFALKGRKAIEIFMPSMPNPYEYIEKCAKDATKEAVEIMMPQGGYLQPENYKMYKDNKVAYLCYNKNYYYPCINQEPLYIIHLEKEIKKYAEPKVEDCFYNLKQEYEKRNYNVEISSGSYEVGLNPKQVSIEIDKKVEINKEETRKYEKFKAKINSPLYDLAVIAQEIVNQETKFCYFEYLGFSLLYHSYSIEKDEVNSETKIYSIKDKKTGKMLRFAVRSCAMPAGM